MTHYTRKYMETLLQKFMDGTTTLDEEKTLTRYFMQADVPAEWEDYRQLFCELEAMRPQPKAKRRWVRWSVAAAVVAAVVLFAAMPSQPTEPAALTAQVDTADVLRPEAPNEEQQPDTTVLRKQPSVPEQPVRRRRLRKPEPTLTDLDKAYALLAQVQEEYRQAEQEIEQVQQEILHAQLTAAGYTPIALEDGTIVYINEPNEYFAYEE